MPQVIDALVETLEHRLNFTHIAIAFIDRAAETLSIVRGVGNAASLQGLTRPLAEVDNDITMQVVRQGQIEVIDGWDDRLDRAIFEREGHADLIRAFVPLRLRDEMLGLIEAGYQRDQRPTITPEEVRVLGGLADQVVIAIDNARLLEQVQTALGETERLYNASQQLSSSLDIPGMLTALAENVHVADINRIVLWLFDYDATDQLESATVAGTWYSGVGEPPPPLGVRFLPEVLHALRFDQAAEPQFVNSVESDPNIGPEMATALRRLKVQAVATLPLWTGGRQVGLLLLESEHPHNFVEHETRPYISLTQQMAISLENRRLFKQIERDAEREHTINRIATRLRNAQSVEQVLSIATQEVRAATRASISIAEIAPVAQPASDQPPSGNGHAARSEA